MNPLSAVKLLFLILVCSACSHHYYTPEEAHLLALEERKDFKVSGSLVNPISSATGGGIQLGYSPIQYIGIQASGFYINSELDDFSIDDRSKGYSGSLALGTYVNLRSKKEAKTDRNVLLDLYGGMSLGKVTNIYPRITSSTFDVRRFYSQAGVHFQDSIIGFDLVFKTGTLDFVDGIIEGEPTSLEQAALDNIEGNNLNFIGETSLRTFYKLKQGKFYFSFSYLLLKDELSLSNNQRILGNNTFSNFTTMIGIVYDLK
ncbi:MAG: hypothetical protein AAF806_12745 [Bacteroidota bacterium]